jgi:hypothetical protein
VGTLVLVAAVGREPCAEAWRNHHAHSGARCACSPTKVLRHVSIGYDRTGTNGSAFGEGADTAGRSGHPLAPGLANGKGLYRVRTGGASKLENSLRYLMALSEVEADSRHECPVEIFQAIWPKLLYGPQHSCGIRQEALDINALTSRRERCQVTRASRQHVHRPVVIPSAKMVKGHANLEDPLIEAAHLARLSPPQYLQCFVLLEVLAAVELPDPLPQKRRRRLVAPTHGPAAADGVKVVVGLHSHAAKCSAIEQGGFLTGPIDDSRSEARHPAPASAMDESPSSGGQLVSHLDRLPTRRITASP